MTTRYLFAVAGLVVLLAGCETRDARRTATTEVLLAAAGFEIKKADTPEQQKNLGTLAQRRIVRHESGGGAVYVYADASTCECLYQGSEADYQRYRDLAASSRASGARSLEAIEAEPGTDPDWAVW